MIVLHNQVLSDADAGVWSAGVGISRGAWIQGAWVQGAWGQGSGVQDQLLLPACLIIGTSLC